jgi:ribonucleoside-diphosphate reductase alpha chain
MRKEILKGHTHRLKTGCGNLYVTINEDEGDPKEIFVRLGKAGGCAASQSEALGRLITLGLRAGVPAERLVKQLRGIGCHQPCGFGPEKTLSCADAVGKTLAKYIHKKAETDVETPKESVPKQEPKKTTSSAPVAQKEPCPDCGATLTMEEGCAKCHFCGFTRC